MIRVGIGGWTYAPWRGTFYPKGLRQADELSYASRHVTTIEINGTFYRTQSPDSFKKWRAETPDDFVFAVKGHRAIVNSRRLADTAEPLAWFFNSGVLDLDEKLGPVLWQFAPFRKFEKDDFGAFLNHLPRKTGARSLMHVVEVRHESFLTAEFIALVREHNVAVAHADSNDYPAIGDITADFVYARLQRAEVKNKTGYASAALDRWAQCAALWQAGKIPDAFPQYAKKAPVRAALPVFIYMINGAKERAPAAATALLERLES